MIDNVYGVPDALRNVSKPLRQGDAKA
jgi:hypothetical protein